MHVHLHLDCLLVWFRTVHIVCALCSMLKEYHLSFFSSYDFHCKKKIKRLFIILDCILGIAVNLKGKFLKKERWYSFNIEQRAHTRCTVLNQTNKKSKCKCTCMYFLSAFLMWRMLSTNLNYLSKQQY